MKSVAIVGGGPGGLFAAQRIEDTCADLCAATIFEASNRLGGKLVTRAFDAAQATYEAGVAEFYDYSHLGGDPIRDLLRWLGLEIVPMRGSSVILGETILNTDRDIRRYLGANTRAAIEAFHKSCVSLGTPADYYEGYWRADNVHPWAYKTFAEILNEIPDETARRYIATAVHSDVAAAPHLTSALNGAKNVLMDNSKYLGLYGIKGGNEQLIHRLARTLCSRVMLNACVIKIGKIPEGRYRVTFRKNGSTEHQDFDYVVLALPHYWLQSIDFEGRQLRPAMEAHIAHYDRPAHYLRVTGLFKEPFWRKDVRGSFFMQDIFGGACLYDESSRQADSEYGVLGWLIAGTDALTLSNLDDETIIRRVLDSLPTALAGGRKHLIEARVHRWVGTVNVIPGGNPMHDMQRRHQPEPEQHPGLLTVGDYLFDSTINGVYDSADFAIDILLTDLRRIKYGSQIEHLTADASGALGGDYFELYDEASTYDESYAEFFGEHYVRDVIRSVWGRKPPYKLLDTGSATGITIGLLEKLGIEAWGVENSSHIHARSVPEWKHRNLLGDVRALPFEDDSFDFIHDTCLAYVPEEDVDTAIREMFRVARVGVLFMGITADMTREMIEQHELFVGVRALATAWQWAERFLKYGFRMAIVNPKILTRTWRIECDANEGDVWYPDKETFRACFFTKPQNSVPLLKPRAHISEPAPIARPTGINASR